MWRVDGDPNFDAEPSADEQLELASAVLRSAETFEIGSGQYQLSNVAEPARKVWRQELSSVGGISALLNFQDAEANRIELSTTHPGGLASFIIGKPTLLSSLIRDPLALKSAIKAAGRIVAKGVELAAARGIDSVYLAIGLAEWKYDNENFRAPILLQPLAIRRYGRDFELQLRSEPRLNPALARAMHEQYQITLDSAAFVNLTKVEGVFKPQPIIDRLRGITSHLSWFSVQPRLVVSSFAEVAADLVQAATNLDHPLLNALGGNQHALAAYQTEAALVTETNPDTRNPDTDTFVLDADSEQERVVNQIIAGKSLVVRTLPGTGSTQTIVNAIAGLASAHKRVLVVSPRRASLDSIRARLSELHLDGLAVGVGGLRRDLIRAITRSEKAQKPKVADINSALTRLRQVLLDYRAALKATSPLAPVTVLDALDELTRLSMLEQSPSTTVRLTANTVELLATDRSQATELLQQAAKLGEFQYGPGDSPWWAATDHDPQAAEIAYAAAKRLQSKLIELQESAFTLIESTSLKQPDSVSAIDGYLNLLYGIRNTLDQFVPDVYDRPLTELIAAASPRRESRQMTSGNRRRLRALAKEYLRPGVRVDNMHQKLVEIQQQRNFWQRYSLTGASPAIPIGMAEVGRQVADVQEELALIEPVIKLHSEHGGLANMPLADLAELINALAKDTQAMQNLHERAELRKQVTALGLDSLLADLATRHLDESQVADELELAWWQSILEQILKSQPALLNANTKVLDRLEADFRLVDEAHVASSAGILAWELAQAWKIALIDHPTEAHELKELLKHGPVTPKNLVAAAPNLYSLLSPVWLYSPYLVGELDEKLEFDAVFLLDAGATTLAETVPSIRRASQVVAFGDPVNQTPAEFEIGIRANSSDPSSIAEHDSSTLAKLTQILPVLSLTRSYRAGGEDLVDLISRRFYGGLIRSLPWAGQFIGHGSLSFEYVADGHGMPDADSGVVESVNTEVDRVVQLVVQHASVSPDQSLMVITPSQRHADRIEQALMQKSASNPHLSKFLLMDRVEPFTVSTIEQAVAQTRDRVVFSIGYGRTPHGRLLSDFGSLSRPGGERLLALAMTSARRYLSIVSCFQPEDIDNSRTKHGIQALAKILAEASRQSQDAELSDTSDALLADLAERLQRKGVRTVLGYRNKLGLVASVGGRALVIDSDGALVDESLRESLRLRPHTLNRLGWHYLRVHSFELFADPDAVAARAAAILGITDPAASANSGQARAS